MPTGLVRTKPIDIAGTQLFVNAATNGGALQVELRDAADQPIPGYTFAESLGLAAPSPENGHGTRNSMQWRTKRDVAELKGKPIRIRFSLQRTDLYAFSFQP
jgi:hypothetical protein